MKLTTICSLVTLSLTALSLKIEAASAAGGGHDVHAPVAAVKTEASKPAAPRSNSHIVM